MESGEKSVGLAAEMQSLAVLLTEVLDFVLK